MVIPADLKSSENNLKNSDWNQKSKRNSELIDVLDNTGVIDKANYPDELSFPGNRFVVSVNNFNRGKLTRETMLSITNCLQLK